MNSPVHPRPLSSAMKRLLVIVLIPALLIGQILVCGRHSHADHSHAEGAHGCRPHIHIGWAGKAHAHSHHHAQADSRGGAAAEARAAESLPGETDVRFQVPADEHHGDAIDVFVSDWLRTSRPFSSVAAASPLPGRFALDCESSAGTRRRDREDGIARASACPLFLRTLSIRC